MRLVVVCGSAFSVNVPGFLWIFAALVPATHKDQALAVAQGASLFFGATLSALLTAKIIQRGKEQ